MKTVIMLMGKSGSGKSYLEQSLGYCSSLRFKKVISHTTRPQRAGEHHARDYHFVTDDVFDKMVEDNELIQTTEFGGYRYGSARSEYTTVEELATLVVVPKSAQSFIPVLRETFPDINICLVYFDISEPRLRINMKLRGDREDYINDRLSQDTLDRDFEETGLVADYIITDDILNRELPLRLVGWLSYEFIPACVMAKQIQEDIDREILKELGYGET